MKNKYDSSVVFLYATGKEHLLPIEFRRQIPYSTICSWRQADYSEYLGHEFRYFFENSFSSTELKFQLYHLKKTLGSVMRSWVTLSHLLLPLIKSAGEDKTQQKQVLRAINYLRERFGLQRSLKLMGISKTLYYQWELEARFECFDSYTQLCVKRAKFAAAPSPLYPAVPVPAIVIILPVLLRIAIILPLTVQRVLSIPSLVSSVARTGIEPFLFNI